MNNKAIREVIKLAQDKCPYCQHTEHNIPIDSLPMRYLPKGCLPEDCLPKGCPPVKYLPVDWVPEEFMPVNNLPVDQVTIHCLPLDGACVMETSPVTLSEGRIPCKYFRTNILPARPELEEQFDKKKRHLKKCVVCGIDFIPANNRQRYCSRCGIEQRNRREARRHRELRARVS